MKYKRFEPDHQFGYTGIKGAAAILGVSKSKLYKLSAGCQVPHCKAGGKLVFKISDLLNFIEERRVPTINK